MALTRNFEVQTSLMWLIKLVTPDVMVLLDSAVEVFTGVKAMFAMLGLLQISFLFDGSLNSFCDHKSS